MTFSLIAYDQQSGACGVVICSSSPAVAARCAHVQTEVGVVSTQNVTNPQLGPWALDILVQGASAVEALEKSIAEDVFPAYRQVAIVDTSGNTAIHNGEQLLGVHHSIQGTGYVAAGNLLSSKSVIDQLVEGYISSSSIHFEERLLAGLQAALEAGGEAGPVHSAGLIVAENYAWPVTDLRVDWSDTPIEDLHQLWKIWKPQKRDYALRAVNPTLAPAYGVPGDYVNEAN